MATVKMEFLPEEALFLAANFPAYKRNLGTAFPVGALGYDAAADETAYWHFQALNYGSGNLTLTIYWYADTASTGDVIWDAGIAAITADTDTQDIETKAFATINSVTDTHLGTTGQRLHQCAITISNLDSVAANDFVALKINRDANNASDTLAGDAFLVAAVLSFSDT
jgi:hypothetical protein